ncbi:MAG: hypothetical protein WCQ95_10300 [Bacteroidota bacterium]
MKKHKKKHNSPANQKIIRAQRKNEYMRKMKYIFNTVAGENVFDFIPHSTLDFFYESRFRSFKLIAEPGHTIPNEVMKNVGMAISVLSKKNMIEVMPNRLKLSVYDYYNYALSVHLLLVLINKEKFLQQEKIMNLMHDFASKRDDQLIVAHNEIYRLFFALSVAYFDFDKLLFWFCYTFDKYAYAEQGLHIIIHVKVREPESLTVSINGNPRPVYRVGWASEANGIEWISIKPSELNIKNSFAEIPLDVYIQSHAVQRLSERLDGIDAQMLQFNVFDSLKGLKVFYDNHNNALIEYRFHNIKVGYLVFEIIEGIIVIKTFLFLTNNGTPEGQQIEKQTGLKKLDKQYLALDKLSTFMTADILTNMEVQKTLTDMGCQSLIELYKNTAVMYEQNKNTSVIMRMLKYLHDEKPDDMAEEDMDQEI